MANFYSTARTNYFRVKNKDTFDSFIAKFNSNFATIEVVEEGDKIALLFDTECGVPSFYWDEKHEDVEIDFAEELATYLAENEVAIIMSVGSEKMRYLDGWAQAINGEGKSIVISLNDIYEKAKGLTKEGTEISKAEY